MNHIFFRQLFCPILSVFQDMPLSRTYFFSARFCAGGMCDAYPSLLT